MNEEPFGPVAVTRAFSTFDEAIEQANRLPFGLAAFAFTENGRRANLIGDLIESGMVGINTFAISVADAPFGGVKDCGLRQRRRQGRPGELPGGEGDPSGLTPSAPRSQRSSVAAEFLGLSAIADRLHLVADRAAARFAGAGSPVITVRVSTRACGDAPTCDRLAGIARRRAAPALVVRAAAARIPRRRSGRRFARTVADLLSAPATLSGSRRPARWP